MAAAACDADSCTATCDTQSRSCKTHETSAACVGANKDKQKCTALKDGLKGYYLDAGLVKQCATQTGCTEHDAAAACVATNKQKCKDKKNAAGYRIKAGVVTKCADGKKMAAAAADADSCTAACATPRAPTARPTTLVPPASAPTRTSRSVRR